jgi:hypothetical protein
MDNAADLRDSLDCPIYSQPFSSEGEKLPQNLIDQLQAQQSKGTFKRVI